MERHRVTRVDRERGHTWEGVAEAEGEEVWVGGGGGRGAEEGMAPRREKRQVEMCDVSEGGRDPVEVTRVPSEREGGARLPLQSEEDPAHERERVPRAGVDDADEHLQQDLLRQVAEGGGLVVSTHLADQVSLSSKILFF